MYYTRPFDIKKLSTISKMWFDINCKKLRRSTETLTELYKGATTLSIMGLLATLSMNDIQHNITTAMLSVVFRLLLC